MRFLLVFGITLVTFLATGMLGSGDYGVAQPALLAACCGAFLAGLAAGRRRWAGAAAGLVCAGLGGAGIVLGIGLREGADYGIALPVMIPLAGIPGCLLGMVGTSFNRAPSR
jgi:hypothetical protein